jgi:hypothetical protein
MFSPFRHNFGMVSAASFLILAAASSLEVFIQSFWACNAVKHIKQHAMDKVNFFINLLFKVSIRIKPPGSFLPEATWWRWAFQ